MLDLTVSGTVMLVTLNHHCHFNLFRLSGGTVLLTRAATFDARRQSNLDLLLESKISSATVPAPQPIGHSLQPYNPVNPTNHHQPLNSGTPKQQRQRVTNPTREA